jgi:Uma2 family endonuclease
LPTTPGPLRLADYLAVPDEPRCELLNGRLFLTAAPRFRHQDVVMALHLELQALRRARGGKVMAARVDVVLSDATVVQPDLCWISPERKERVEARVEGAPNLVVEVLSPGSERIDHTLKLGLYLGSDVDEYWIVDPDLCFVQVFWRAADGVQTSTFATGILHSPAFPELAIDLDRLWAGLDDWSPTAPG